MAGAKAARDTRTGERRRVVVGAVAVLALALVAAVLVLPRLIDSPERARRTFVEALAAGDAGRVAGVTRDLPRSAGVGVAAMKAAGGLPTNPAATGDGIAFDLAGTRHEVPLAVEKVGGRWKVVAPTAELLLAGFPVAASIDGIAVTEPTQPLLPGVHVVASADPLVAFEPVTVVVSDPTRSVQPPRPTPVLTDAGLAAVRAAASASLTECLAKKGLAVSGCPNVAGPPPGLVLDEATVEWALAGQDPTTSLSLGLEPGRAWGTSRPLDIPLAVTAGAVRRYDGTPTTYRQPVTVRARVFASITNGVVSVTWTQ